MLTLLLKALIIYTLASYVLYAVWTVFGSKSVAEFFFSVLMFPFAPFILPYRVYSRIRNGG